jgi:hypothetical protein
VWLTSLGRSGNTRGRFAGLPPTLVCSVSAARHSTKRSVRRRSRASLNTTDQGDLGAPGAWKERSSSAAHSPITEFMVDCRTRGQEQQTHKHLVKAVTWKYTCWTAGSSLSSWRTGGHAQQRRRRRGRGQERQRHNSMVRTVTWNCTQSAGMLRGNNRVRREHGRRTCTSTHKNTAARLQWAPVPNSSNTQDVAAAAAQAHSIIHPTASHHPSHTCRTAMLHPQTKPPQHHTTPSPPAEQQP